MSKPYWLKYIGIIFILQVVVISCGEIKEKTADRISTDFPVDAVKIVAQNFKTQLKVTANLLPYEQVEIKAPVSGTVLAINFNEGQFVKKGQLIVHLDDRAWIAQEKGLEAQLLSARADLRRKEELLTMEGASQQDVDQAKATVDGLEAQIEELKVRISLANVSAPFDGKLGMRDFSLGSYLNQGQVITNLSQSWKLKVDFSFASQYKDQVAEGKLVQVISNGDTVNSVIYAVNPIASNTSRTLQIRALIEDNQKNFIPGDFAEVLVPIQVDEQAMVVPTDCIVPELNSNTLFVFKNGKSFRKTVELGARTDLLVQVLSGIEIGDTVLTTGLMRVRDNFPVQINKIIETASL
jgi:membrane fusion protein (multidrug efflux system)